MKRSTHHNTQRARASVAANAFDPVEHSVYLGRQRLGRYRQTSPKCFCAFDWENRALGDYTKQKAACAAIANASRLQR